ncbi:hypothetical protein [Thermococcus eurythermalis]|uniref:hypothetical protein n=1 Tax=Thermococcus eurythermalis TaxID=1505907 RepID=UPI00130DE008|nr:hypothetical protein [Thermococcus eurythermalis]
MVVMDRGPTTENEKYIVKLVRDLAESRMEFYQSQLPPLCAGRECNSSAWAIFGF